MSLVSAAWQQLCSTQPDPVARESWDEIMSELEVRDLGLSPEKHLRELKACHSMHLGLEVDECKLTKASHSIEILSKRQSHESQRGFAWPLA